MPSLLCTQTNKTDIELARGSLKATGHRDNQKDEIEQWTAVIESDSKQQAGLPPAVLEVMLMKDKSNQLGKGEKLHKLTDSQRQKYMINDIHIYQEISTIQYRGTNSQVSMHGLAGAL